MSKDQQEVQKAFIKKEKAKIIRKRSEKSKFMTNYLKKSFDPLYNINRPPEA